MKIVRMAGLTALLAAGLLVGLSQANPASAYSNNNCSGATGTCTAQACDGSYAETNNSNNGHGHATALACGGGSSAIANAYHGGIAISGTAGYGEHVTTTAIGLGSTAGAAEGSNETVLIGLNACSAAVIGNCSNVNITTAHAYNEFGTVGAAAGASQGGTVTLGSSDANGFATANACTGNGIYIIYGANTSGPNGSSFEMCANGVVVDP